MTDYSDPDWFSREHESEFDDTYEVELKIEQLRLLEGALDDKRVAIQAGRRQGRAVVQEMIQEIAHYVRDQQWQDVNMIDDNNDENDCYLDRVGAK